MNHPPLPAPAPVAAARQDEIFYTEESTARWLGLSQRTLQKWRARGCGPKFVRVSQRCIRYRRSDLLIWAQKHIHGSTSEYTR